MTDKKDVLTRFVNEIHTLAEALMIAKSCDFISTPEAKLIFTDMLKATGFKQAQNPLPAPKKEEVK